MAIFRTRALDAANRSSVLTAPVLLPRPQLRRRLKGNLSQLREALLPSRSIRLVRTQEIRQQDPTECGAVSLAIVLQHHGCNVPLSTLRRACGVSRDGSDAANLVRAAKLFGLETKGFKKGLEALKSVTLPAILFWNFDHFLVLEGLEGGRYWLNDPASGRRSVDLDEFDRCYTGVVLTMQPGSSFQPSQARPGPARQLWERLRLQGRAELVAVMASAGAATALLTLLPTTTIPTQPWLPPLLLLAIALQPLAQALSRRLQRSGSRRLQQRLLGLPDWLLQQHFSAELSGRHGLVLQVSRFLQQQWWLSAPLLLSCLLWGLVLLPSQPVLSLLLWSWAGLFGLASRWNEEQQRSREAQQRMARQRPAAILQGGLLQPDTLKASALERDLFLHWAGLDALATRERQRLAYSRDLQGWIPQLLGWSLPPLMVAAGMSLTSPGLSLTVLVAVALGLALAQQRTQALVRHWGESRAAMSSLESVEAEPQDPLLLDPAQPTVAPSRSGPKGDGARLELEAVSFGYVPVQPPLIQSFTLRVEPGQRIAIVGGSASGKSTLARLIAGLLQPTAGVVKLNGKPLMEWPRNERLRAIAMVQQGLPLLSCSVRENLTFWDDTVSQADVEQACHKAAILERIEALPQGFATPMQTAGHNLSGGEKQRLQIAQALLQQPELLILDEATSALDAGTELQVEQALRELRCTQIVVAHRLSTIRDADEILVLDQGNLVQRGTHAQMAMKMNSVYQQLLLLEGVGDSMDTKQRQGRDRDA